MATLGFEPVKEVRVAYIGAAAWRIPPTQFAPALTLSPAPAGFARWSLRLLEEKVDAHPVAEIRS
jgi:hypothetical protein